jgi:hypothetical protein
MCGMALSAKDAFSGTDFSLCGNPVLDLQALKRLLIFQALCRG